MPYAKVVRFCFILDGCRNVCWLIFRGELYNYLSYNSYANNRLQSVLRLNKKYMEIIMDNSIVLEQLNIKEGARYLGYGVETPDERIMDLIKVCEKEILATAKPRITYKVFNVAQTDLGVYVEGTSLILKGESIKELLNGCSRAVFLCGTLSDSMDKLIRTTTIRDMAKAVIMDAFASVAVEQVCDKAEMIIKNQFKNQYFTYRFGIGYGDLPLEQMPEFLKVLNTEKTIGVTVNTSNMMTPTKSVACIIGISENEIKSKKKGCLSCNMKDVCQFRIRGERCGF